MSILREAAGECLHSRHINIHEARLQDIMQGVPF